MPPTRSLNAQPGSTECPRTIRSGEQTMRLGAGRPSRTLMGRSGTIEASPSVYLGSTWGCEEPPGLTTEASNRPVPAVHRAASTPRALSRCRTSDLLASLQGSSDGYHDLLAPPEFAGALCYSRRPTGMKHSRSQDDAPFPSSPPSRFSLSLPLPAAAALASGGAFGSKVCTGTRFLAASSWTMPLT